MKKSKNHWIDIWRKELGKFSGNFTTNEYMPNNLKRKLLEENLLCKEKLSFKDVNFPKLEKDLNTIKGLHILAGFQKIKKKGCVTVFRSIRFPTYKRICEMISAFGCAVPNYEQERILELYKDRKYISRREKIKQHRNFWTQPQERVVDGLPVFSLVNDALQIHRAWRGEKDRVAMIVIHIPYELVKNNKLKLIANAAIDLDYGNTKRDCEIKDFVQKNRVWNFDFESLRSRGIDLHEMYLKNFPWTLEECDNLCIEQDFFLLDIYEIRDKRKIRGLFNNSKILRENRYFLHGFFGDQNIFGRRPTKYLPYKCQRITARQ